MEYVILNLEGHALHKDGEMYDYRNMNPKDLKVFGDFDEALSELERQRKLFASNMEVMLGVKVLAVIINDENEFYAHHVVKIKK